MRSRRRALQAPRLRALLREVPYLLPESRKRPRLPRLRCHQRRIRGIRGRHAWSNGTGQRTPPPPVDDRQDRRLIKWPAQLEKVFRYLPFSSEFYTTRYARRLKNPSAPMDFSESIHDAYSIRALPRCVRRFKNTTLIRCSHCPECVRRLNNPTAIPDRRV